MNDAATLSRTRRLGTKLIRASLELIRDNGGEMSRRDLLVAIEKSVKFDAWEQERAAKTGAIRWSYVLGFYSIGASKAGFLVKNKGVWYVTPEGLQAIKEKDEIQLAQAIKSAYQRWKADQPDPEDEADVETAALSGGGQLLVLDEIEQLASESLEKAINSKGPYEFQDLVAALLRGMGYFTPFVAPKGKDGGIDVIAYGDPLGTKPPRIKVQVKHRDSAATVKEVRELLGVLRQEGDVGIFVSTGGFASDAKAAAANAKDHLELIDLQRFINFWREFYDRLSEADKSLLPLRGVYFHAPTGG